MEFPERLRRRDRGDDDEEVIRPNATTNNVFMGVNQSIFGLITAAGSRVNFNDLGHSSDEDEDDEDEDVVADVAARPPPRVASPLSTPDDDDALEAFVKPRRKARFGTDGAGEGRDKDDADKPRRHPFRNISQSSIFKRDKTDRSDRNDKGDNDKSDKKDRDRFDGKLLRSLPALPALKKRLSIRKSSASRSRTRGGHGEDSPPTPTERDDDAPAIQVTRDRSSSMRSIAPVMSRMLEAKAALATGSGAGCGGRGRDDRDDRTATTSTDASTNSLTAGGRYAYADAGAADNSDADADADAEADARATSALERKLMDIFEFDQPEQVIEEYPCWLLQSLLLQGYMYITAHHICFYAYLPKKANEVAKSGYLAKSGKRNPKYSRYWFRLKGDVLSYYRDPANLYFPHGQIDLRYSISATVTPAAAGGDGLHFQVVTNNRTFYFRADSAPSAKEWVKSLQRVIFRSHNDGDSVKISLPIDNIIDIEENPSLVEFTDTCKIRVIDNDETFAVDEYFFSFFEKGKDAIRILKILIDDAGKDDVRDGRLSHDSGGASTGAVGTVSQLAAASATSATSPSVPGRAPRLDSVRATLQPGASSPRASGELPRSSFDALRSSLAGGPAAASRKSLDLAQAIGGNSIRRSFSDRVGPRASTDRQRHSSAHYRGMPHGSPSADKTDKTDKSELGDSMQTSFSNLNASSSDDPSASQILNGSEVFKTDKADTKEKKEKRDKKDKRRPAGLPHAVTTGQLSLGASDAADGYPSDDAGLTQNLARLGSFPLQRAGAYADWLNRTSRRMSSLLATESMGYVEKVSGMWKGGRQHFDDGESGGELEGVAAADLETSSTLLQQPHPLTPGLPDAGADTIVSNEHFREHFALPPSEKLQATYFGHMMRVLPLYGKIYMSSRYFCFRSMLPGTRTKLILPLQDIENVNKEKGTRFRYAGLVVVIRGHEELFFDFFQNDMRDECALTLMRLVERARYLKEAAVPELEEDPGEKEVAEAALAERNALQEAREAAAAVAAVTAATVTASAASVTASTSASISASISGVSDSPISDTQRERTAAEKEKTVLRPTFTSEAPTILFDDPKASFLNFKPSEPMRITCLTIGSRGDVQPYIALGRGLVKEGHSVCIATHPEFETWIRSHGLDYARVEGDPGELMRICIENGTFTLQFLREANSKMRTWLDELLSSAWTACQGSDLLIESPSAMAGIHIAERLQIPYFRAFTMPWTRTRAYPHAFLMPEHKMGGAYNYFTYTMFEAVFWRATAAQINRWRKKTLGIRSTSLEKMQVNKVPFLYNFSPRVVPPPLDYSDWIRVTGYWFLDEAAAGGGVNDTTWTPPADLAAFIAKARADGKKIVYVGFGSIVVQDPAKMTQEVVDAVQRADVRCILSKGWSDRMAKGEGGASDKPEEPAMPDDIFQIKSAPHDWLFAQIDAAAHHGGSGTTGASLRAGIPTIIRPFFGDQFFFGQRVEDLGVGLCLKKWGAASFAEALWEATNSSRMIRKAAILGEQIREENGVDTAIQCIYRDMEYAKSVVKEKVAKSGQTVGGGVGGAGAAAAGGLGLDESAEVLPAHVAQAHDSAADDEYDDEVPEESWTFVGEDADPMQQSVILARPPPPSPSQEGSRSQTPVAGYRSLSTRILGISR